MVIEAVLWDFGGVITTSPFEAFNRYEAKVGLPRDFIRRVNATNPDSNAWAQFESSRIDLESFDLAFAEESAALGHRIHGKEVVKLLTGDIRPEMVEVLRECKKKSKVGCITNNLKIGHGAAMADTRARANHIAEVMEEFDVVVQSSVEGVRKPDPGIYTIACRRLGVEPERCVYLDDLGVNLKPARAMGMQTIKVTEPEQAIAELSRITGWPL